MTEEPDDADTAAAVLAVLRDRRAAADRAERELVQAAVSWAGMHSTDSIDEAASWWEHMFGDEAMPLAGPGAPLVAEFSVAEFAAAVGLSTEAGKAYLGEAIELRHRLPKVWARVVAGDLVVWKARRIARATMGLSVEAVAYVDQHVARVAHKIRVAGLDRMIAAAMAAYMPEETERRRRDAADGRCFNVGKPESGLDGTTDVWGTLDAADALDLDAAVAAGAEALKDLGSTESLDVRRSQAVAGLARRQLSFDLNRPDAGAEGSGRTMTLRKPRQVVLHVHLAEAAIRGEGGIGRMENHRSPVTAEQIRQWCANPDAQVVVKPVIDLADHHHVEAYEVPVRIAEQAVLINVSCVFPWCTAQRGRCDSEHITPFARGGTTSSDNIVPLCRRHHRLKTHGRWRYIRLEAGSFLWTSPHGYQFLRNETGTLDVSRDHRRPDPPPPRSDDQPPDQPPDRQP